MAQTAKTCTYPRCGLPALARGYCSGHYNQLRRGSDLRPLRGAEAAMEPSERMRFHDPEAEAGRFRDWCADTLVVPTGVLEGQPLIIQDWQHNYNVDVFSANRASQSCARKNGKSSQIASLFIYFLHPSGRGFPNFRGTSSSFTTNLAMQLLDQMDMMIHASPAIDEADYKFNRSSMPRVEHKPSRSVLRILNGGMAGGHGGFSHLSCVDELGIYTDAMRGNVSSMRAAIAASGGKYVSISVQGTSKLFREERDLAADDDGSRFRFREYAPDDIDAPPHAIETWHAGNPGLGSIKTMEFMEDEYKAALLDDEQMADFRRFQLNLAVVSAGLPICTPEQWLRCVHLVPPAPRGPCYIGVDLGDTASLTSAALYWPLCGLLRVRSAAPGNMSLEERGLRDGVGRLYVDMAAAGELEHYPDSLVTPAEPFISRIVEECRDNGYVVAGVWGDRYRIDTLRGILTRSGAEFWNVTPYGQGWRDHTPMVIGMEQAILSGRIRTAMSLQMNMAISKSKVVRGEAGARKFERRGGNARIDPLIASAIAVAQGSDAVGLVDIDERPPRRSRLAALG